MAQGEFFDVFDVNCLRLEEGEERVPHHLERVVPDFFHKADQICRAAQVDLLVLWARFENLSSQFEWLTLLRVESLASKADLTPSIDFGSRGSSGSELSPKAAGYSCCSFNSSSSSSFSSSPSSEESS